LFEFAEYAAATREYEKQGQEKMTEALDLFDASKVPDATLPDDRDALQKSYHCVGGKKGIWWFWTPPAFFIFIVHRAIVVVEHFPVF
jgi:hypothetical protein